MIAINPFKLKDKLERCKLIEEWMSCTQTFMSREAADLYQNEFLALKSSLCLGYIVSVAFFTLLSLALFLAVFFTTLAGWSLPFSPSANDMATGWLMIAMPISCLVTLWVGVMHPFVSVPDPEFLGEVSGDDIIRLRKVSDTTPVKRFMGHRSREGAYFSLGQLNSLVESGEKELKDRVAKSLYEKFQINDTREGDYVS